MQRYLKAKRRRRKQVRAVQDPELTLASSLLGLRIIVVRGAVKF